MQQKQTPCTNWITASENSQARCSVDQEYPIDKGSWSLNSEETSLDYDNKITLINLEGLTLPCLTSDGFCKQVLKYPITTVWFPQDYCLIVQLSDLIGLMSKLNKFYWLETDDFFSIIGKNTEKNCKGI